MIVCGSVVIVNMCEAIEKCVNVKMLVYKIQVRLRESLWSILTVGGHFSFLGFCIKECDVNKCVKLYVC